MDDERVLDLLEQLNCRLKLLPPWLRTLLGALLRGSLVLLIWRIHGQL